MGYQRAYWIGLTTLLVAAFFACSEQSTSEGAIYCLLPKYSVVTETAKPGKHKNIARFKPHVIAARIARQSVIITAHPDPKKSLPEALGDCDKYEIHAISADYKKKMPFELNHYGLNGTEIQKALFSAISLGAQYFKN